MLLGTDNTNAYQVTFQPRVSLTTEFTDNRERLSEDELEEDEDEEKDIITTLSPGFQISAIGKSQGLTLDYAPFYRWYQENQDDNTLGHNGNLAIYNQITRNTRLYASGVFSYTDDPTIEHIDGEQTDREGREPYYSNSTNIGIEYQFGPSDVFTLEYNYNMLQNEEDALDDSIERNPTAALTYYPLRSTGIDLLFSFTQGEFDNDLDRDDPDFLEPADNFENYFISTRLIQRLSRMFSAHIGYNRTVMDFEKDEDFNYELHYPNVGASYQHEDTTSISLSIGYLVLDRKKEFDDLEDDERFLVNANISRIWQFRTAALNVNASSGYNESYFDDDNQGLRIFYNCIASFNHEFLRGIGYELNGGYRVDQYLNTDDEREDHTKTAGVGLVFSRIGFLTARLDYTYRDVTSDLDGDGDVEDPEYTENRISFTITLTPRNPTYLKR